MNVAELIEIARYDYLDDAKAELLWDQPSMFRRLTEAERQACNRTDLIYDDSTPAFTQIKLAADVASYRFHPKITVIERFLWNGVVCQKVTKDMLDRTCPHWRTLTGLAGNTPRVLVQGRSIRLVPTPTAADVLVAPHLALEVYRLPKANADNPGYEFEIPAEYHRDLLYWVLHDAYKKQDADTFNQEKSDYYLSRFNAVFGPSVPANVRVHQFETPRPLQILPHAYSPKLTTIDSAW